MYRRGWMRLPKLDYARPDRTPGDPDFNRPQYRREDWAFLWILLIIGSTGYVLEAARLVWLKDHADVWDKPVVVARRRPGRPGAGRTRSGGAWRRSAASRSVVVSWIDRAGSDRIDSLYQGQTYIYRGGFLDGARPARGSATVAHSGFAAAGGCRKDHPISIGNNC